MCIEEDNKRKFEKESMNKVFLRPWEEAIGTLENVNKEWLLFSKFSLITPGLNTRDLNEFIGRKIGVLNMGGTYKVREVEDG